jgi:hypothetical protein
MVSIGVRVQSSRRHRPNFSSNTTDVDASVRLGDGGNSREDQGIPESYWYHRAVTSWTVNSCYALESRRTPSATSLASTLRSSSDQEATAGESTEEGGVPLGDVQARGSYSGGRWRRSLAQVSLGFCSTPIEDCTHSILSRRYWTVLSEGQLISYRDWKTALAILNEPLNLRYATARISRNTDRRFCLEVITPASRWIYQALTEEDAAEWVAAINRSIESLINGYVSIYPFSCHSNSFTN